MTKERIRRWTWISVTFCAVIGFVWVLISSGGALVSALGGALVCAVIPLFVGGWLLFAPPDSPGSPLRYMWRKPPSIEHSDTPDQPHVHHKPKR